MLQEIKIIAHNGKQFIPNIQTAVVPAPFRGIPVISKINVDESELVSICPTGAISANPLTINLGKCVFCGECAFRFPQKISFTNNHKMGTNKLVDLLITEFSSPKIEICKNSIRPEIRGIFNKSLKLRQVSAGGDNSAEFELNASGNANFDMGRFGIEFVASPRHADGILVTGPITQNMANALEIAYNAVPHPKVFILCGTDAISGGIFADSPAIDRSFLKNITVDLYIPGNPPHPLTIINALLDLIS